MQWVVEQNAAKTAVGVRPFAPSARVKVGHHYGELVTQARDGKWLIKWDNLPVSQLKQYGEPPESGALFAERIELISVRT